MDAARTPRTPRPPRPAAAPTAPDRPVCGAPGCRRPAARRYDRPGTFRLWCDTHTRRRPHGRPPPPPRHPPANPAPCHGRDPTPRACPVAGCVRLREIRRHHPTVYRWTCQAHRGAIPDRVTPPPPEPKVRTPWKPTHNAAAPTSRKPPTSPLARPPITNPAMVVTTASDGAWPLTRADLDFLLQNQDRPAFTVSMERSLPTSVVYRVWGMAERGEIPT